MTLYDSFTAELAKLSGIGDVPAGTWKPKSRKMGTILLRQLRAKSPRKARETLARLKGEQQTRELTGLGKKVKKIFTEHGVTGLPKIQMPTPEHAGKVTRGLQRSVEKQRRLLHRGGQKMTPAMRRLAQKSYGKAYERGAEWGLAQKGGAPPPDPADWWKRK